LTALLDDRWSHAGRPDPFTAVVVSGDEGELASVLLEATPACGPALRYIAVNPDRSGPGEDSEPPPGLARLARFEDPAFLYPAANPVELDPADADLWDSEFGDRPVARGIGPLVTYLTDVPSFGEGGGVIVAVEVLSPRPYDLFEWRDGGWLEVRVAVEGPAGLERIVEVPVPAGSGAPSEPGTREGERARRQIGARDWLSGVLTASADGVLAVVDRWDPEAAGTDPAGDWLDLAQLRQVRRPVAGPRPVPGTGLSEVTWRLGRVAP
jgi:hypothetical protein